MSEPLVLSVVIPAHNEEGNLFRTIEAIDAALRAAGIPNEILVVDDHSSDGTAEMLEGLVKRFPTLRTVPNLRQGGFGHALHTGLDEFRGDAVVLVMADASDDPQDIVAYYRKLEEGYECVFGSRFISGGKVSDYPPHKLVLNRLANLFIKLLFGLPFNDVTNAFKCYRRSVIDGLRPILSHHFNITVELPLKAIVRGYAYAVIPIRWYGRVHGVSKLRIREMGSRYLFIVLYVLLEKLLSRGDYRRPGQASRPAPVVKPALAPGRPSMLLPWTAFGFVVAVHLLFMQTYPLNYLGGDTPGYFFLMMYRRSNLCHAPGYPFLIGLPLTFEKIQRAAFDHDATFRAVLLVVQHAIDLLSLAVFMSVIARVFNRRAAILTVLIAGVSLQGMAVTSAVYPEWLQADLLMLAISFALLAWRRPSIGGKTFWYALSFGALTWSYLVKFNAAVFFPLLMLAIACEKLRWKQRAKVLATAAAFGFLNYAAFVGFYHHPKTETYDLSYDHSWVLMAKLAAVYDGKLPYTEGIATKRWLALGGVLPPRYDVASLGPFDAVDAIYVVASDRVTYNAIATEILTTQDVAVLDRIIREHPLPPTFNLNISSIPVSWYVGLKESDELGIAVFWENVLHHPRPYLMDVARNVRDTLRNSTVEWLFPTTDNIAKFSTKVTPVGQYFRLEQAAGPYRYGDAMVWRPGFLFFSKIFDLSGKSHRLRVDLVLLGFVAAIVAGFLCGWSPRTLVPVLLSIFLGGFVLMTCGVLQFRWKDMRFILPVVAMLIGVFGGWTLPALYRAISDRLARLSGKRQEAATAGDVEQTLQLRR